MHKTIAMVFAGGRVEELAVLTERRPKAAVVFGGSYRTIDFALTNLATAGIGRVGILAQWRPSSLMDHVAAGTAWDLFGADRGVRFLPPYLGLGAAEWYRGPADALYQNIDFIQRNSAEDVLIVSADHAYHMDYGPLISFHRERDADLTVAFKPVGDAANRFGVGELNAVGQIMNFTEKPEYPRTNLASMSVYVFKRQVLVDELLGAQRGSGESQTSQIHEVLRRMIPRRRAYGYVFHGEWHYTRNLDEYFAFHRDLLGPSPRVDLAAWEVRSNFMARRRCPPPPAQILPGAHVENSLISAGCRVAGTVRNSVLSPGVWIAPGATVVDGVLWDDVVVEADAVVEGVIADKRVRIGSGARIGVGEVKVNEKYPRSLKEGCTVLGMDVKVPNAARVGRGCILAPDLDEHDFVREIPSGTYLDKVATQKEVQA